MDDLEKRILIFGETRRGQPVISLGCESTGARAQDLNSRSRSAARRAAADTASDTDPRHTVGGRSGGPQNLLLCQRFPQITAPGVEEGFGIVTAEVATPR